MTHKISMTNSPWASKGNCKPPTWTAPFMDTVKVLPLPFLLQVQCEADSELETKMHFRAIICTFWYTLSYCKTFISLPVCAQLIFYVCTYKSKYSIMFPSGRRPTASTTIDHACWTSGIRSSDFSSLRRSCTNANYPWQETQINIDSWRLYRLTLCCLLHWGWDLGRG